MDKEQIGNLAGIVWRTLNEKGKLSSALGWLLCEGELFVSTEDGREYLELRMDYDF